MKSCDARIGSIFCKKHLAKQRPYNYIALSLFTLFFSYIVMWFCSLYDAASVMVAACLSVAVTIGLTVYAFTTKQDFTMLRGVMVGVVIAVIFFSIAISLNTDDFVNMILVLIIIIIYSVFIVYDVELIAGGRYRELDYEDYVIGALLLFVDTIGLFMYILMLVGRKGG